MNSHEQIEDEIRKRAEAHSRHYRNRSAMENWVQAEEDVLKLLRPDTIYATYKQEFKKAPLIVTIIWMCFQVAMLVYYYVTYYGLSCHHTLCQYMDFFVPAELIIIIVTPIWFFIEYNWLIDHNNMNSQRYEHLQHVQTLAAAVWAGFGAVALILIVEGFEQCTNKAIPLPSGYPSSGLFLE